MKTASRIFACFFGRGFCVQYFFFLRIAYLFFTRARCMRAFGWMRIY